jgi:hypothetical protein
MAVKNMMSAGKKYAGCKCAQKDRRSGALHQKLAANYGILDD